MSIIRVGEDSVRLCCSGQACPIVKDLGNGTVEIIDDDGNRVVMKKEEAKLISDGVRTLDKESLLLG